MTVRFRNPFLGNYIGIIGAIIVIGIFLSFASPYFLKANNFVNIGNQIAINLIIAVGMTLVITSGGIDLSVGANVALTGIVVALYFSSAGDDPYMIFLGLLLGVMVGSGIGLVNGVIINRLNVTVIGYKWDADIHYVPSWMEIVVTLTILFIEIWIFRWIVRRLPVLREPPGWAKEHE